MRQGRDKRLGPAPVQVTNGKLICIEHVKGRVWSFVWEGQNTCKSDLNFGIWWEGKGQIGLCSITAILHCMESLSRWLP